MLISRHVFRTSFTTLTEGPFPHSGQEELRPKSATRKILGLPEVWVRFLGALIGLGLAFATALLSTVSREAGNLWATAALAATALLLAVLVGLTTVPYLARRVVAGASWQDAFDFEVTRAGIVYVVLTLLIGVAALNTGNNLLYIVVAAMLAAILASGIASGVNLQGVTLQAVLPRQVFARQGAPAALVLGNRASRVPRFSISVLPPQAGKQRLRWQAEPGTFGFPPGRPPQQQWFRLPDRQYRRIALDEAPPLFENRAYFPYLPPRESAEVDLKLSFERRGRYHQQGMIMATRFPLGLLNKRRRVPLEEYLVVFPAFVPSEQISRYLSQISGEKESFIRGQGQDLYSIREHRPEDSARHVDWKATAKSGALKVREFTREDERKLRIVFDNPEPGQVSVQDYEQAVSLAASLAWTFAGQGVSLTFAAPGLVAEAGLTDFLTYLALVEPVTASRFLSHLPPSPAFHLLFTARAASLLPEALLERSFLVGFGNAASLPAAQK